ncbi:hypothetical protein PENTCL1PPCAC_29211, partial [Pristionchus entomophagus]
TGGDRPQSGTAAAAAAAGPSTSPPEEPWPDVTAANGMRPQHVHTLATLRQGDSQHSISPEAMEALRKSLRNVRQGEDILTSVLNSANTDSPQHAHEVFKMLKLVVTSGTDALPTNSTYVPEDPMSLLANLQAQSAAYQQSSGAETNLLQQLQLEQQAAAAQRQQQQEQQEQ